MNSANKQLNVVVGRGGIATQLISQLIEKDEKVLVLARGPVEGLDTPMFT